MSSTVIKVENISKQYRLGKVGTGTLAHDLKRWWAVTRGKEDPFLKIGEENDRTKKGSNEYVWALRDISFDVKQGEVVGIIGRNGAGKSTLLKILSRTTAPTTGSVKAKGRIASLLEVGTGFHPELTGRENVFLNGAILGMTKREIKSKFDEIIGFAGVERYVDTPVKRYSSGMYVRLAFAVAAYLDPEILIVDEVLAVGDAEFQKRAIGKMQDISRGEGRTVLFVSHNMGSIRRLCSKGVYMNQGQVESVGEINETIDLYLRGNRDETSRSVSYTPNSRKDISITEVSITAEGKTEEQVFDITDKLKVKIKYVVKEDIKGTHLSLALNKDGIMLFRSWDIDSNQAIYNLRKKGEHIVEVVMPDFLLPGTYSLYVASGKPGVGAIDVKEDCLIFELENVKIDGSFSSFTRGGLIKSNIHWNILQENK